MEGNTPDTMIVTVTSDNDSFLFLRILNLNYLNIAV